MWAGPPPDLFSAANQSEPYYAVAFVRARFLSAAAAHDPAAREVFTHTINVMHLESVASVWPWAICRDLHRHRQRAGLPTPLREEGQGLRGDEPRTAASRWMGCFARAWRGRGAA